MKLYLPFIVLLLTGTGFCAESSPSAEQSRKSAVKLAKEGNWKECLELNRKLLTDVDDAQSWKDLENALQALRNLRQPGLADELIEGAARDHAGNSSVLRKAAKGYQQLQHSGFLLDGEFQRGFNRGGGAYVSCIGRDRVRSIQLILQAIEKAGPGDAGSLSDMYSELAMYLSSGRTGSRRVWALGVLTGLDELPDFGSDQRLSSGSGAPVDSDGELLLIRVPESWDAARNDGERWRWAVSESVKLQSAKGPGAAEQWARFLVQHYGVGTLSGFGWWRQQDPDDAKGIMQVHTLKEAETIVRLAAGVKRLELPADYQFIPLLRRLSTGKGSNASLGDLLVQVFLDRRQLVSASKELKRLIKTHGRGEASQRQKLLGQIEGDWGRFESAPMAQAGKKPKVDFIYRNAEEVSLSLHELKMDLVIEDLFKHLEGNPRQIDSSIVNVSRIGSRLVNQNQKKYLGREVRAWKVKLQPRENHWDTRGELEMPVSRAGAYILKATAGKGNSSWIVVWISDTALISHQLREGKLFYLGESRAGAPLGGELEFFGYRVERRKGVGAVLRKFEVKTKRVRRKVGADGAVILERNVLDQDYQWMTVGRSLEGGRALMGFQHQGWHDFRWQSLNQSKSYGITDRPVYRPEQKVHLKFWSRTARHDLDEASLFANRECSIEIRHQNKGKVQEFKNLRTDEFGGVEAEWELPADARLGMYHAVIKGELPGGSVRFRVEEYKKPEFEVMVEAPEEPVQLGELIKAKVLAKYYHGAPVTEGRVKVKVERLTHSHSWFPQGRWDWLYGRGYWWFGQDYPWYPGWEDWGCVAPVPPWWGGGRWTPPELVMEREFEIGPDGTVKVEIDTSVAKLVHGDMDHRYSISAEVVDSSRRTIRGFGSVLAARHPYTATVWLNRGYARPGDTLEASFSARTLDGKAVQVTGSADLFRVQVDEEGRIEEEKVKSFQLEEKEKGGGEVRFKAPGPGQYRFAVRLIDEKGNKEEGATVFLVRNVDDDGSRSRFNPLELVLNKKEYTPGEEARILVNTRQKNSAVLLFLRSNGNSATEMRPVRIKGRSKEVGLKLTRADIPNIHVHAVTLINGAVVTETRQIVLPPEKRLISVEVLPGKEKFKPREKATLKLKLRDENGEPYRGTTVVTVYDKSLEAIAGGSNVQNIRDFFWSWTRTFHGHGMRHSQHLAGRNLSKSKAPTMRTLGRFGRVLADKESAVFFSGRGIARSGLPQVAADSLSLDESADSPAEAPLMKQAAGAVGLAEGGLGNVDVQGRGDRPQVMVRSEFADLVKWAGSITTDERGEAEIEVEYPDNLTTWKVKAWALGHGTRVGEGSAEVITSKDLIVRLQAPRFFVESDEVVLSAVVHNYHEEAREVNVSLELDGGTMKVSGPGFARVIIPAGGEKRVDWSAVAVREGAVTVRMKAVSLGGDEVLDAGDDSDAMEMSFPVYVHGMLRTESWSRVLRRGEEAMTIDFEVPEERRPEQTRLEIRYSPTVAGAMVDALPYLADYPYGCTEQTVNRFVPAVITQRLLQDMEIDLNEVKNKRVNLNPQEVGEPAARAAQWKQWKENPVWDKARVDSMVSKGVKRLREMQNRDGGWGWFSAYGERSYPHTTAVVVHGLTVARSNGARVPDDMLQRGVSWLRKHETGQAEMIRMWERRKKKTKQRANALDALVRRVLGEAAVEHEEMLGFLFRDKVELPVYGKCLLGLELHRTGDAAKRDAVIRNIEQFLEVDEENQTAWLELGNGGYWWRWYGSEFEAHAWYLKLLAAAKPRSPQASGLVKYLVNNRKHATYWNSTRDTAYCIEGIADYLRESAEADPDMEVEVVLDGKVLKTVKISKENLFNFDGVAVVAGDAIGSGKHKVELRSKGEGSLYANVYLTVFSKEKFIQKAGLEVKVDRTLYKLVPAKAVEDVAGSRGQALRQRREKYERVRLEVGDVVESGDLIEVELSVESKNDYSYLVFEDWKAAGLEAVELRSGHSHAGGLSSFVEYRDEKVALFVRSLPRGRHNLSYRLRAEVPGKFSALPTRAEAMYAPELRANSDEMKIVVRDRGN